MKSFFLIFIMFSSFVYSQNNEIEIITLVNKNIVPFLEKIPKNQEYQFGFHQRSDFSKCISERPIQVLTLNNKNKIVKQLIWRVPVSLYGKNKILFTVIFKDNKFVIVDIGGAKLAQELQSFQKEKKLYLLRLYSHAIDFITHSSSEDSFLMKFYPLKSAQLFLQNKNLEKKSSFNIHEILSLIK